MRRARAGRSTTTRRCRRARPPRRDCAASIAARAPESRMRSHHRRQALAEIGSGCPPHSFICLMAVASSSVECQRALGRRAWQHLQRHVDEHAERARASRPARARRRSRRRSSSRGRRSDSSRHGRRSAGAEDEVAHRPGRRRARGPASPAAIAAADGGARPEVRRLERQHLLAFVQCGLEFRQRRAAAHRDDQFGRLVVDDAACSRADRATRRGSALP